MQRLTRPETLLRRQTQVACAFAVPPMFVALVLAMVTVASAADTPADQEGKPSDVNVAEGADFKGLRLDYAQWLRDGHGWYCIDDAPEYEWSGIVNNALLTLAFGDDDKAWQDNALEQFRKALAAQAFHDQLLWAVPESTVPEDANRVWADALEAYLFLKERFTVAQQREIEDFFRDGAKTYAEARKQRWGHQYVPHAFAALTGHVLSQSVTGADYKQDIAWLWRYAQEKSYDFGEIMGPVEHSGHYTTYTYPAMVRVGVSVCGWTGEMGNCPRSTSET